MSFLTKVVGDPMRREVKRHQSTVERVNELEDELKSLSDQELAAKTAEFRRRLGVAAPDLTLCQPYHASLDGDESEQTEAAAQEDRRNRELAAKLDEILPEAFAVVREMSRRVLGMRHFDVQLIGGIVLHQGKIAEMRTGEGKTLVATLPLYLNALAWRGAHLVTVNDYLARRDAGWNSPLYHALGMTVGVIAGEGMSYIYDPEYLDESHPDKRLQHLRPCTRREAYGADITYATNNELGFDYLRDNMQRSLESCVQRQLHYAIVDEVDSILIDEARTPLIISGEGNEPTEKYYQYARLIPRLDPDEDFTVDEKVRKASLTEEGIAKIEKWTGISNVYALEHADEAHQIEQALRAHACYMLDRDYIIQDGEVIIVDEFTGRTMPGRRWSDGLHQAIEAKEGVKVQQENVTMATITFQNFFRLYNKLAGMTGTALTEAEEFDKIYKLEVVPIPTHRPMIRKDETDLIFKTEAAKYNAVADEIADRAKIGQPILVGTTSIEKSERLAHLLEKRGIKHSVLNAKFHEKEATIVAEAGKSGAVTIATNMAGRGTDIVLGEGVQDAGGLYIIGTERHESRRIDNQLRGRSGRQGDPGESRFFLSFEDDLMRVFGGERMQSIMERLHIDEDVPIENRLVSRQIESAQSKVEGHNFDSRRYVVEYDDVMNKQREIIYGERRKILEGVDTRSNVLRFVTNTVREIVSQYCEGRSATWDLHGLWERMRQIAPLPEHETVELDSLGGDADEVAETLVGELTAILQEREEKFGAELMRRVEQELMLQVVDQKWVAYLTQMDHLREGVGFQGYGQNDPLIEYKALAFQTFQDLVQDIQEEVVRHLLHAEVRPVEQPAEPAPQAALAATAPAGGRADRGNREEMSLERAPAARPAAAQASAALARSQSWNRGPAVKNVRESVGGEGERASNVSATGKSEKVGRNQPCPCGSGKKYKFCHGQ
jgi:preprotein translocase subunit SecA